MKKLLLLAMLLPALARAQYTDVTAQAESTIALQPNPTGIGGPLSVINDGEYGTLGSSDFSKQYDSYDGTIKNPDWFGYTFTSDQTFTKMTYQDGIASGGGRWHTTPTIEVRVSGVWTAVSNADWDVAYYSPQNYTTYQITFDGISGDGIRLTGQPINNSGYTSCGELRVYTGGGSDANGPTISNIVVNPTLKLPGTYIYWTASFTDQVGVDSIYLFVDGALQHDTVVTAKPTSFSYTSNYDTFALGSHTYQIRAVDTLNNVSVYNGTFDIDTALAMSVTAYFPVWSLGADWLGVNPMHPREVSWTGITHIVHFGVNPKTDSPYWMPNTAAGIQDSLDLLRGGGWVYPANTYWMMDSLKTYARPYGVKILLSVGGIWGDGQVTMDYITDDSTRTQVFVDRVVSFIKQHDYDGVEIDYEPPKSAANFSLLTRIMRRKLTTDYEVAKGRDATLIVAVANGYADRYPLAIADSIDQFNFMMYDMEAVGSGWCYGCAIDVVGFNAPLHRPDSSLYPIMNQYQWNYDGDTPAIGAAPVGGPLHFIALGFPADKVAPGIPFFGYTYTGIDAPNQPRNGEWKKIMTHRAAKYMLQRGGTYHWDATSKVPWIGGTATEAIGWQVAPGQRFYFTYDDTASIVEKVKWTQSNGMSRIMVYELWQGWDKDNPAGQKNQLMDALISAIDADTSVSVPAVPTLSTPANGALVDEAPTLAFTWSASAGASSYGLQIATNASFTNIVHAASYGTNAATIANSLVQGVVHYWRVNASSVVGTSSWSTARTFTVRQGTLPPAVPTLDDPDSASTGVSINPTFRWTAGSADTVTAWGLQVAPDPAFSSDALIFSNDSSLTAPSRQIVGLSTSTTYYWRARAKNSAGSSAWSDYWSFTTSATEPIAGENSAPPVWYDGTKQRRTPPAFLTFQDIDKSAWVDPDTGFISIYGRGIKIQGQDPIEFSGGAIGGLTASAIMAALNGQQNTATTAWRFPYIGVGKAPNPTYAVDVQGDIYATGNITGVFFGDGSAITDLNASALTAGVVPISQLDTTTYLATISDLNGATSYDIGARQYDSTGIASGKILKFDGTKWAIADDQTAAGGAGDIDSVYAGDGLSGTTGSGNVNLNVVVESDRGLQIASDSLGIKLEGGTLTVGANGLRADTTTWLATQHDLSTQVNTVTAGNGLQGGGSTSAVTLDASPASAGGLEISSDSMRVKLNGATLTRGFAGIAVDTAIVASRYYVTSQGYITGVTAGDGLHGTTTHDVAPGYAGGLQITSDSLAIKRLGNTLGVGATGLYVDTAIVASQYDLTQLGISAKLDSSRAFKWWVSGSGQAQDSIRFVQGSNITLTKTGHTLTIAAAGGGTGGGILDTVNAGYGIIASRTNDSVQVVRVDTTTLFQNFVAVEDGQSGQITYFATDDSLTGKTVGGGLTVTASTIHVDTTNIATQYDLTQAAGTFKGWYKEGSALVTDSLRFSQGSNITLTQTGSVLTIASTGGGSSDGQDADSIMAQRVDTVGRALAGKWTGLAYSVDSLKYKHLYQPLLDTAGTKGATSKLYIDTDGKVKVGADNSTAGSGLGILDTVRAGWGTVVTILSDSVISLRVDTTDVATESFVTSQGYITGVTAGDGLHGTTTHDAAPASAGGLQITADSLAIKPLGATLGVAWGGVYVDTAIIASQYDISAFITGVTAGDGLHGTTTHDAAPLSAGGLQVTSDSLAIKTLGATLSVAWGGVSVDTSIIATQYDLTQAAGTFKGWYKEGSALVTDSLRFSQGANITLTQTGSVLTIASTGGGSSDGQDADSIQGRPITTTAPARGSKTYEAVVFAKDSGTAGVYEHFFMPKLDTSGVGTALQWDSATESIKRFTPAGAGDIEAVTAGSGLQGGGTSGSVTLTADPASAGGLQVSSDSLAIKPLGATLGVAWGGVYVDTAIIATQYDISSFITGVTAGDGLHGTTTHDAAPASAGGLQITSDSLAVKRFGNTLGVGATGLYADTSILATQYDLTQTGGTFKGWYKEGSALVTDSLRFSQGANITLTQTGSVLTIAASGVGGGDITSVVAGSGLQGGGTENDVTLTADPASAGGLQITSDSLAVKRLGNTLSVAWGGLSVDTSIVGTKYDDTQLITAVTAGANVQQGGTSGTAVVDVVPGSAGGLEGSNDSLQVKLNGATLTRGFAGMAVDTTTLVASQYDLTTIPLNQIANPTATKSFSMGAYGLEFLIANPTSPALSIEGTGNFTDDLLHIHQNTGNPATGSMLLHLESVDTDPLNLYSTSANDTNAHFAGGRVHTDSIQTKGIRVDSVANLFTAAAGQGWLYGRGASGLFYQYQGGRIRVDSTWPAGAGGGVKAWYTEGGAVNVDSLRFAAGTGISFTQSGNRLTITNNGADNTDSLARKFVDSSGRAIANKWTVPAFHPDSNRYKSLWTPLLDTTGTKGSTSKLYLDTDLKIKIGTGGGTGDSTFVRAKMDSLQSRTYGRQIYVGDTLTASKQIMYTSSYSNVFLNAGTFIPAAGDLVGAATLAVDPDNTNDWSVDYFSFDPDAANYISGLVHMPYDWDATTAPKFKIIAYAVTGAANNVAWDVQTGYIRPGSDSWVGALGTAVEVTQAYGTSNRWEETSAIAPTPAGTAAAGAWLKIRIYRDAADATNDTFTAAIRFVGLEMQYKVKGMPQASW